VSASANTSATGGYLTEKPPPTLTSAEIERILQHMVASLTSLPGNLVRPRWQPIPPTQPMADVTWGSVGVMKQEVDDFPEIIHDGQAMLEGAPGFGVDRMRRHSTLTVLVTFYGPEAEDVAGMLRDALYIPQQMEGMRPLKLKSVQDLARGPELVNQQWINRADMQIEFRYQIDRVYPVLNLVGADVVTRNEDGVLQEIRVRPNTVLTPMEDIEP
jgi:hypothetical protein